ncbi:MAG: peroxiredoxin [Candidatus Gracilibacteria bacterium]
MAIRIGDHIPAFSLPLPDGKSFDISKSTDKHHVIFFYPRDETSGCIKEACSFRDNYETFQKAGAEVIGISSDSKKSHQLFQRKHRLPFKLLSDEAGKVRKLFGVPKTLGLFPGRVTYIVDKEGVVRHIFNSQFNAEQHVKEALEILSKM